ncbi:MAG: AAA family ATPase, partial [Halarsenatibacteraceae bacterium]
MRLKNIYLNDFGIYNNQSLEGLSPNIVVIGGPNRSGKTTFMQILRYLGYGIPRRDGVPAPADKYDIEADIETEDNLAYQLKLKGYAEPSVISLSGQDSGIESVSQLYNNLDRFTYQQLFTISLDELKREPVGLSSTDDKSRLQSILLGAGLSKIVELPQAVNYFDNQAYRIGRTTGKASVGEFKPYQENLAEAENKKDEALKQVEDYISTVEEIEEIEGELKVLDLELARLEKERIRLDLLKNNYNDFSRLQNLKQELINHPGAALNKREFTENKKLKAENLLEDLKSRNEKYQNQVSIFKSRVSSEKIAEIKTYLLEKGSRLEKLQRAASGLKEKIKNYQEQQDKHSSDLKNIKSEAAEYNQDWQDNFQEIKAIRTDQIERRKLLNDLAEYKDYRDKLRAKEEVRAELENKIEKVKESLSQLADGKPDRIFKRSLLAGLIFIAGGATIAFINIIAAPIIAAGGLALSYLYYFSYYQQEFNLKKEKQELVEELSSLQQDLDKLENEIESIAKKKVGFEDQLKRYRELLGLDNTAGPDLIKDYFNGLRDINNSYNKWLKTKEELKEKEIQLMEELKEIRDLLAGFNKIIFDSDLILPGEDKLIAKADGLFSALDQAGDFLDYARNLSDAEEARKFTRAEIKREFQSFSDKTETAFEFLQNYIHKSRQYQDYQEHKEKIKQLSSQLEAKISSADHIIEAFRNSNLAEADDLLTDIFQKLFNSFTSLEEVKEGYNQVKEELQLKIDDKKQKEDKLQTLKDKREELASPEKIEEAHREIDQNQSELRKLAENYALNRTISFIFKEVQSRAIKKAKEELLQPAADLLAEMTEGEYQEINPPEDIKENDFKTKLASGREQGTVKILSRGTQEQLFLAVRLSRIQEIEPSLPVILDDSLVNFDASHLENTVQILSRLGNSHQIFVLTCHPHLVSYINDYADNVQYWHLQSGKFKNVAGEVLY